jgi:hypothetical protein
MSVAAASEERFFLTAGVAQWRQRLYTPEDVRRVHFVVWKSLLRWLSAISRPLSLCRTL